MHTVSRNCGEDAHGHRGGNGHECTEPQVRCPVQPIDTTEVALPNNKSCESDSIDKDNTPPAVDTVADDSVAIVPTQDSDSIKDKPCSEVVESSGRKDPPFRVFYRQRQDLGCGQTCDRYIYGVHHNQRYYYRETMILHDDNHNSREDAPAVTDDSVAIVPKWDFDSEDKKPCSEAVGSSGRKDQGSGPKLNIDIDILSSIRRHPFKAILASPLLLLSATSLAAVTVSAAVFSVSTVLCAAFIGFDEKKQPVTQEDQPGPGVTTLKPEESTK